MNNTQTAAIYIRVSTDAQREEGYSIEAQTEMLKAFCVTKQIKNYELYIDGGYTGSNMDRPELQRLIRDVKSGQVGAVIVYKLDRLSRSQKDTLYLIEDVFNPHNVDFVSMNESMDTSTPMGRLMLGILSAFAQLERENIRERTRMGMKERVKNGYWPGGGRIPFGYDYDKEQGILVPNKDAETVRKIYRLYLDGHSPDSIAKIVGLKYDRLAVQILTRKTNYGVIYYNGVEYQGRHEPIISKETYDKTMAYMRERSVTRVSGSEYLLTGLLECGKCGAKMRYQKWGKHDAKIVCYSQYNSKPYLVKDPNCNNKRLWASEVEQVVINDLFAFSLKQSDVAPDNSEEQTVLSMLHDQYEEVSRRLKKLYGLYSEGCDDILLETIREVQQNLKHIQERIDAEAEKTAYSGEMQDIHRTLSTIKDTWQYMTPAEKKKIVRSCVEKVVIDDDRVQVYYKFNIAK